MNLIKDVYQWLETADVKPKLTIEEKWLAIELLEEEVDELKHAVSENNPEQILDGLVDILWICGNVLKFNGLTVEQFEDYAQKVSMSNWSKFCGSKTIADLTVIAYQEGTHPSKLGEKIDCYAEQVRDLWVVKRKDGKILKGLNYREPNQY